MTLMKALRAHAVEIAGEALGLGAFLFNRPRGYLHGFLSVAARAFPLQAVSGARSTCICYRKAGTHQAPAIRGAWSHGSGREIERAKSKCRLVP
jgi:hypothetical protein